jgi:hypothetical protein
MKSLPRATGRWWQFVLIISTVGFSWLAMQVVHELGHVLAAWTSNGQVVKVVLHPLAFSRTDVLPNPHPLWVTWAGPVMGSVLPVVVWSMLAWLKACHVFLARFFAGFCLVANGVYLSVGSWFQEADPGDLMRLGVPQLGLVVCGLVTAGIGLWFWNGQGRDFGLGVAKGEVDRHAAVVALLLLASLVLVELALWDH